MSLLNQRQDRDYIVFWAGRAGDYLRAELRISAAQFPTREPTAAERTGRNDPRQGVYKSKHARGVYRPR